MLPLYGLFIAAQNGHAEVVRWLISLRTEDHFASPADTFGEENESTALHFAAMNDHIEIMKMLLEDENAPDVNQGTGTNEIPFFLCIC
jgi:ankyrin repeat protein